MSGKVIGVRRWVAMTVLSATLLAGGIFGVWAMSWSGHTVLGAAKVALKMAGNTNPVSLGSFSNGFSGDREAGAAGGGGDLFLEDGENSYERAAFLERSVLPPIFRRSVWRSEPETARRSASRVLVPA